MSKQGLNPFRKDAAPYRSVSTGELAVNAATRLNSKEPLFNRQGELNADSNKDAARQIQSFHQSLASGQYRRDWLAEANIGSNRAERHQMLASAYNDSTGKQWQSLGAALVELLANQQIREGIVRRIAVNVPLSDGEVPRIMTARSDAVAVISTGISSVEFQEVRARQVYPTEVPLIANLRVQHIDLQQVSGDILEKIYNDGVEAIMVAEDRLWKQAADDCVNFSGQRTILAGGFTPALLGSIRMAQNATGFGAATMILGLNAADAMVGNSAFYDLYDPVTKYELIQSGGLGSVFGTQLITDAYRVQHLRVIEPDEVYVVSTPGLHAGYTDRNGVVGYPVDGAQTGSDSRGWFLRESFSVGIVDTRSVTKGTIRR